MGTSVDLYVRLGGQDLDDTSFGVALGVVSTTISIFFILKWTLFAISGVDSATLAWKSPVNSPLWQ